MYTGRYVTQQGNLGHEIINLFKADDGNFYIWLNSMGVCKKVEEKEEYTIIMVRSINSTLYKVLAKATKCKLCDGANISRKKQNSGTEDKEKRFNKQKELKVTYNGKSIIEVFKQQNNENDMFATFKTKNFFETKGDIYLTNDNMERNNPRS